MIVFVLLAAALCLAFVPALLFGVRRRKATELRRDWWPQFEAEFRAYAARVAAAADGAERRDARRPPRSFP